MCTDIQEVLISHVDELTEKELEEMRVLNEPQGSHSLVEKPQLTIIALNKGLQLVDN
jgi:ribosomal protein L10